MLGSIVLVAFLAASGVVACILFVLFGPVPVKRKVTIVSRIQPPLPMAAAAVFIEPPHRAFAPSPVLAFAPPAPPAMAAVAVEPMAAVAVEPPVARRPTTAPPARRPPTSPRPPVAPLAVRHPRGESPPALPRSRSARGTEPRPRHVFDSVEMTALAARRPNFDSVEVTAREAPGFEVDEMTHVDDDRRA